MTLSVLALFVAVLMGASGYCGAEPVKVIFDTDISSDVDDCGALAILNALADKGEAQILACVVDGHDADRAAVAAVGAINHYYARGDVPIGAYHGDHGTPSKSKYTGKLRDEFPTGAASDDKAPDALMIYRRTLAGAPDGSVVIISVGFLMNLGDLLDSRSDDLSPLTGGELIRAKVKRLVVMGGQFPNPQHHEEWNFTAGGAPHVAMDTRHVIDGWPTPILFSGFSIGYGISTGPALESTTASNPVRRAYELFDNALKNGRSSWDLTAVLAAVRDPQRYWNIVSDGCCTLSDKGVNDWSPVPHRGHAYLAPKLSNDELVLALNSLMAIPPASAAHPTTKQ